jgi:hypothetical protein
MQRHLPQCCFWKYPERTVPSYPADNIKQQQLIEKSDGHENGTKQNERRCTLCYLDGLRNNLSTLSTEVIRRKIQARHRPHVGDDISKGDNTYILTCVL